MNNIRIKIDLLLSYKSISFIKNNICLLIVLLCLELRFYLNSWIAFVMHGLKILREAKRGRHLHYIRIVSLHVAGSL